MATRKKATPAKEEVAPATELDIKELDIVEEAIPFYFPAEDDGAPATWRPVLPRDVLWGEAGHRVLSDLVRKTLEREEAITEQFLQKNGVTREDVYGGDYVLVKEALPSSAAPEYVISQDTNEVKVIPPRFKLKLYRLIAEEEN